jgi:hypothetical protein
MGNIKGISIAFDRLKVATEYIPAGKTSDQYCGSYLSGTF